MFYNGKTADYFSGIYLNEIAGCATMVHPNAFIYDILIELKKYFNLSIRSEILVYEIQSEKNELYITFSDEYMWYECYYDLQNRDVMGYIIEPLTV